MPDWTPHIRSRLASLRLSPTRENEIVEELSQHLEDGWRELVAGGASEADATRLALGQFRDDTSLATLMAPLRQAQLPVAVTPGASGRRLLGGLLQDVRYAWRLSWRRPGFTVAAVLTLALGIGANSAIFSLVDAVLLRSLPVSRPEELVLIEQIMVRGSTQNISRPLFEHLREEGRVFSGVLAAQDGLTEVRLGDAARDSQTANVQAVSGEYFQVLGASASTGRTFTRDDDRAPGAHPVAVRTASASPRGSGERASSHQSGSRAIAARKRGGAQLFGQSRTLWVKRCSASIAPWLISTSPLLAPPFCRSYYFHVLSRPARPSCNRLRKSFRLVSQLPEEVGSDGRAVAPSRSSGAKVGIVPSAARHSRSRGIKCTFPGICVIEDGGTAECCVGDRADYARYENVAPSTL